MFVNVEELHPTLFFLQLLGAVVLEVILLILTAVG